MKFSRKTRSSYVPRHAHAGDIGVDPHEVEYEPLSVPAPVEAPEPVVVPELEPVPA